MTTVDERVRSRSDRAAEGGEVDESHVWDLPVRVFHWTLAVAIAAAFVTNWLGVSYFRYHVWCGYAVLVLVSFRVLWGLIGTRHARFRSFVRGPAETLRYGYRLLTGRPPHYVGHNPLGALMVVALLAAVAVQAITGLFGNDEIFNYGPLYGYVSKQSSLALTSLHKKLFYWIVAAIAIHILAVVAHHVFWREKLVHAMVTGKKTVKGAASTDGIKSSRTWLAAIIVIAIAGGLAYIVGHAPPPDADDETTFQ